MIILNFTAEREMRRLGPLDPGESWCVIKLNDYEIGRVEMSNFHPNDERDAVETAAAVWLSDILGSAQHYRMHSG